MRIPRLLFLYPVALAHCLWTLTFGLFSKTSRCAIALLAYQSRWYKSPIPEIDLTKIIAEAPEITLCQPASFPGNVSTAELLAIAGLTRKLQPRNLFEFGTFDGRSSLNLIAQAPMEAHLYTLDLPASEVGNAQLSLEKGELRFIEKERSGLRFQGTPYEKRITQLYGDSATFDFSPYLGRMDFVFVDASHAYDYVRCDTGNALKLLAPEGGLILWHDYSLDWLGVIRALDEFYRSDSRFRGLRRIAGTTLTMLDLRGNLL